MTGIQIGGGNLGTLLSTAPLAAASATIGWRASFLGVAAAAAVISILLLIFIDDRASLERIAGRSRETPRPLLSGVREAALVRGFWTIFALQATTSSSFAAILGLCGGPWLTQA